MQLTELEKEQLEAAKVLPNEVLKQAVRYRAETGQISEADCRSIGSQAGTVAMHRRLEGGL